MRSSLLLCALLLFGCSASSPSPEIDSANQSVIQGHLSNGLAYHIAPNSEPENRVYIRLVVNAGSMNEDDDQRGVAHIVEHMAFNGSANFPGNAVIEELEGVGMKFGQDINAFTDFENTVYTLNLPNNEPKTLALAMTAVGDWAGRITMDRNDLNAERGIVLEEWRSRLGPMLRLGDKKSAFEMAGSRYVLRDPIGDPDTILNVPVKRVADFYRRWYRTDNMSVVIAGDISRGQALELIEAHLGYLSVADKPKPIIDYAIPLPPKWRAGSVSEAGFDEPALELSFLSPLTRDYSEARFRRDLADQVASRLLNLRLQEWEQQPQWKVNSASYFSSVLGRETQQQVFTLQLQSNEFELAAQGLFDLLAQIKQQGFLPEEIRNEIKRLTKLNGRERRAVSSQRYAGDLMVAAATESPWFEYEPMRKRHADILATLSNEEVNQAFLRMIQPKARLALMTTQGAADDASPLPDAERFEALWQQSQSRSQERYQMSTTKSDLPLISVQTGTLTLVKQWQDDNVKEYQLSNGSRLLYRFNDQEPGEVHFKALTSGGLYAAPKSLYHQLRGAVSLVDEFGVGDIEQQQINDATGHYPVVLSTLLDNDVQGFSGWANQDDLDILFSLFRTKLNEVVIDPQQFERYLEDTAKRLKSASNDAQDQFIRESYRQRLGDAPHIYSLDLQTLNGFKLEQLEDIYRAQILGKTDFDYFIVGDIDEASMLKLVETYLASTPVKVKATSHWQPQVNTPDKPLLMALSKEPRTEVEFILTAAAMEDESQEIALEIAGDLLQDQLRLELREKASGVYGVSGWLWQEVGEPHANGRIGFSCAPERASELVQLAQTTMTDLARLGVSASNLENKIQQRQDQLQQTMQTNLGWMEMLSYRYMRDGDLTQLHTEQQVLESLTTRQVNQVLRQFLSTSDHFDTRLSPRTKQK